MAPNTITPPGRKPTVLGAGTPPGTPAPKEPETAPSTPASKPKPTAIKAQPTATVPADTAAATPTSTEKSKPTAIGAPPPSAPPTPANPAYATHTTAVAGTVRKAIEVDQKALEQYFIGTPVDTIAQVRRILAGTILDTLTDVQCARWGEEEQKRYGDLTQKALDLVSADAIKDGSTHLARLFTLLKDIGDAFQQRSSQSFFSWGGTADPKDVFEQHQKELTQLWRLLDKLLPAIMDTEAKLTALTAEFEQLAPVLDAQSLAAQYLSQVLLAKSDKDMTRQNLEGRGVSLMQTVAYIRQGIVLRGEQVKSLHQLVTRIQEGVHNALPAWIQMVTMTFQKPTRTETDVYTLRNGLDNIIRQLS